MYRYPPFSFKRFFLIKEKVHQYLPVRMACVLALLPFFCSFPLNAQNSMLPQGIAEHERKMIAAPFAHLIAVDNNNSSKTAGKLIVLYSMLVLSAGLFLVCRLKSSQYLLTKYVFTLFRKHKNENNSTLEVPSDRLEIIEIPAKTFHAISTETYHSILKKISKFEKSEKFLRKDINLTWLSNHLNTNTKYLSEVIKQHKNTNFNGYINGLRIQYIIKKLTETPVYRGYKISYLAEECGYGSPQVFAIAFKRETGVTPSYFIEQLKNGPNNTLNKSSA